MLFQPQQTSIGLDISDRSLKAVQFKRNLKGGLSPQAFSECELPAGIFDDGELKQPELLARALGELLGNPKFGTFNTTYVTASLPETKTFIKMIDIPPMPTEEIKQAVKWEAEHHIPIPIEDTYWDWQQIGTPAANARLPVLLAVVPKNIVDSYTQAITQAKLVPLALEVEAVPIARSLLPLTTTEPKGTASTMIIDVGATRTSLMVIDLGTIQFTVSLPISGRRITETIASALKLTETQAEKAKLICGLDPKKCHGAMGEILHQTMDELVNRIRESIVFYREHFPQGNQIGNIVLCGGGANFKLIDKYLGDKLQLPVERGNPWQHLEPTPVPLKPNELISYTTAIGLALRAALDGSAYG
ncbi:MAG: type IV pilus assembly protein PilM [Candidatus Veblenbacteria bacterium]|nr:type IV pilus assembly protein PilM [Candidatus Veblenbacteria bacterium]MDZ4230036.1 type IV pilus assembly protein PilM [Candidatus Veblenbacteria bacterium]